MDVKFKNNIKIKKEEAVNLYKDYLNSNKNNSQLIFEAINDDPTNPEIAMKYLKSLKKIDNITKAQFYDVISKEQLTNINIKKVFNNREIFFYLVEY